jgi:hypothetical protein
MDDFPGRQTRLTMLFLSFEKKPSGSVYAIGLMPGVHPDARDGSGGRAAAAWFALLMIRADAPLADAPLIAQNTSKQE